MAPQEPPLDPPLQRTPRIRQLVVGVSLEVAIEKKCNAVYSKLIHAILKFRELIFADCYIGIRENRENYAPRKFGRIRY